MDDRSSLERFKRSSLGSYKTQTESDIVSLHMNNFSKSVKKEQLLHEASIRNDIALAKKLIDSKIGIDSKTHMDSTPCHWAAMHGNIEILIMLIEAQCDLEAMDKFGMTPVLVAAWYGHQGSLEVLIENGANCHMVNKKSQNIIHCAVKSNEPSVVTYLLESIKDIDLNRTDRDGQTALHMAVINDSYEIVQRLIEANVDLSIRDKNDRTCVHYAASKGHHQILDNLVRNHVDLNETADDGKSPLHLAIECGHLDAAEILLKNNCDMSSTDSKGRTSLHMAASKGDCDAIDLLIRYRASINCKERKGNTPLHVASANNHDSAVRLLVNKGAAINAINARAQTALHLAAESGFTEVAEILIESGADLSLPEKSGRTALYIAARGSFTAIVDMLIKAERIQHTKQQRTNCESGSNSRKSSIERNTSIDSNETQTTYSTIRDTCNPDSNGPDTNLRLIKDILYSLSRNHLEMNDWKRLAKLWDFTDEHIKAIEHQYTGKTSYKEHAYRMMLIWLHGLPSNKNPVKELIDALYAIGKKDVAGFELMKYRQKNSEDSRTLASAQIHKKRWRQKSQSVNGVEKGSLDVVPGRE